MSVCAVIVAAGRSERFDGVLPKQFHLLAGKPMLLRTIKQFERATSIDGILLVVAEDRVGYDRENLAGSTRKSKLIDIVAGGANRQESVRRGLEALPSSTRLVAIHDGARPLVAPDDIDKVVAVAEESGAAILATPVTDTVKRAGDKFVLATIDRSNLYLAQTPQVFRYDLILSAHRMFAEEVCGTDDAMLAEKKGLKVGIVEPSRQNIKITTRDDLRIAEVLSQEYDDG